MRLGVGRTDDHDTIRAAARAWVTANVPEAWHAASAGGRAAIRAVRPRSDYEAWYPTFADSGMAVATWPVEFGGLDLTVEQAKVIEDVIGPFNLGRLNPLGLHNAAPPLFAFGTEEQRLRFLPPIVRNEERWCQLFSEPGAGSDLASLQTRALRDGDEYVINGQKIWTSGAHFADWLFTLVRTNPDAPKHRGISFLMLDINSPGVTVRPIIDMGWNHPFNETFFEDVKVPVTNRIGEEDRGWYVGMTLLDFERSGISDAISYRRGQKDLRDFLTSSGGEQFTRQDFSVVRKELADRAVETEVLFNFAFRIVSIQDSGMVPNYEASVNKMYSSELHQRIARTSTKAWGLYGNLWADDSAYSPMNAAHVRDYVGSVPHTIFSGSNEIQRNVIATRGLGLPRG